MKEWQFTVLFFVGVGGAVLLLIGPEIGLNISKNPTAVAGVGSILAYVLAQRKAITHQKTDQPKHKQGDDDGPEPGTESP